MSNSIPTLGKSDQNLVWLKCEMTGLDPEVDRLIEIAVVVTGPHLDPRVEGPAIVIHQSDAQLAHMDSWNQGTHGATGLIHKVKASAIHESVAEDIVLEFLTRYVPKNASPLCGCMVGQDRRFLVRYMPRLEAFFHYRSLDVDSVRELARRWRPDLRYGFKKELTHRALVDLNQSIEELGFYRAHFLKVV